MKLLHKAHISGQLLRYLATGAVSLAIDYGLLLLLAAYLHVHYLVAAAVAFVAAESFSFVLSLQWVFEVKTKVRRSHLYLMFQLVGLIGLAMTLVGMYLLSDNLLLANLREWLADELNLSVRFYLLPKAVTTVVVFFWHFAAKKWLLSRRPELLMEKLRNQRAELA